jgi:hypothetical protein
VSHCEVAVLELPVEREVDVARHVHRVDHLGVHVVAQTCRVAKGDDTWPSRVRHSRVQHTRTRRRKGGTAGSCRKRDGVVRVRRSPVQHTRARRRKGGKAEKEVAVFVSACLKHNNQSQPTTLRQVEARLHVYCSGFLLSVVCVIAENNKESERGTPYSRSSYLGPLGQQNSQSQTQSGRQEVRPCRWRPWCTRHLSTPLRAAGGCTCVAWTRCWSQTVQSVGSCLSGAL